MVKNESSADPSAQQQQEHGYHNNVAHNNIFASHHHPRFHTGHNHRRRQDLSTAVQRVMNAKNSKIGCELRTLWNHQEEEHHAPLPACGQVL